MNNLQNQINEEDINPFLDLKDTKNNDIIVVQIGSHSIKFGLASQTQPFVIPNVIAHLIKPESTQINIELDDLSLNENFINCVNEIENCIVQKENKNKMAKKLAVLNINKSLENQGQYQISEIPERINEQMPDSLCSYKKMEKISNDLNDDITDNNFKWTSLASKPRTLIGREALCIPSNNNDYEVRFPIKYGYFNCDFSFYTVLNDLSLILKYCFEKILKINENDFKNYNIVYIIPDLFIKTEIKAMINLFFKFFGFKNIFLHLESVMSSFGLAIQSSCVVDIGSDKLNICCVDEGMIIENTLIRKNLGGKEITKLLYLITKYLATNNNNKENNSQNNVNNNKFPYELFNIKDFRDFRIFEKLKENECELPPLLDTGLGINQLTPKKAKIWLHRKGSPTKLINVVLIEEAYLAPLCLLYPKIVETFRAKKIQKISWYNDLTGENFEDCEDVIGELVKIISISEKKDDNNNNNNINNSNINTNVAPSVGSASPRKSNNKDEDDSLIGSPSKSESNKSFSEDKDDLKNNENKINYENLWDLNYGLDDLICQSLMSVTNKDLRKKLANSIILVGGTSKLKGLVDFMEDRLINKLSELDNEIERVEILNYPDINLKNLSWIGGSILPKLESSKDMWIQKERWLGEPEKLEERIENNVDMNNKKENNGEKKENENNNCDVGSEGEKSKIDEKNNENNNNDGNNKDKDKDGKKEKKDGDKKKDDGNKKKKIERHLDGGIILLREKCPFPW
jgi:actin-related protein 8